MITYSGGLRLSEVINLKIKDIDSKRMQIFVRQAKGRKDRYTLLSKEALAALHKYYKVSTRTLRHCFGTHLLENGTDLRYIQALMGYESSKTTEIYTHVTTKGFNQIENQLDKLEV